MRAIWSLAGTMILSGCVTLAPVTSVPALRETEPVGFEGDAADDPAIWAAPDPAASLVIGTQKKGGLFVFDLSGAIVQEAPGGLPNNVDLRDDFPWSEGRAPLVASGDRSDNAIVIWRLDPREGRLDPAPRARIPTGWAEVYGFCLGWSDADLLALATSTLGEVGLWRLQATEGGSVSGEPVGAFSLGSIAEGCVIDDDAGLAYIAEENVGIWRFRLNDANGEARMLVDAVGAGRLVADVEGLTIWRGPHGEGYLIASVQGANRFAVYERAAPNQYLGSFTIAAGGGADAVTETDGIDVVSAPLGPDFPDGLFVAQDDRNTDPRETQNFKYVSVRSILGSLGLPGRQNPD